MDSLAFTVLIAFTLLLVKHFLFDFMWQPPFQWKNKGTYGHLGGVLHALQHAIPTAVILAWLGVEPAVYVFLSSAELVIHYHVDWLKMNINKAAGWGPNTHEQFWQLLGADQLAHHLTYTWIVYMAFLT